MPYGLVRQIVLVMSLVLLCAAQMLWAQADGASEAHAIARLSSDVLFRRAKNGVTHGDYRAAIRDLRDIIYPLRLATEDELIEARKLLGISLYLEEQVGEAEEEFSKLLYLRPDFQLDPFFVAPPIIEFFEKIRTKLQTQLDVLKGIRREREAEIQRDDAAESGKELVVRYQRVNYHHMSPFASWLPLGIGQFQAGRHNLGRVFLFSELGLLALNLGSSFIYYLMSREVIDANPGQAQATRLMANISLGLFAGVWVSGAIEAWVRYEPLRVDVEDTLPREPGF